MIKILGILLFLFINVLPSFSEKISGNVVQDEQLRPNNVVIDSNSKKPVKGARVSVPQYGFSTKTDESGRFQLNANIDEKAILQVEKDGYRPFSITIDETVNNAPLKLGIEKTNLSADIFMDSKIHHLGDNMFSKNSANCKQFRLHSMGPYYSKNIKMSAISNDKEAILVFGSIIGLDTKLAKELGQNSIVSVYSSPLRVVFNGEIIAEIQINGDNQQVVIPSSLIKQNNELVIKTGKNLFQYDYTDYDDMEFANLRIEIRDRMFANK